MSTTHGGMCDAAMSDPLEGFEADDRFEKDMNVIGRVEGY